MHWDRFDICEAYAVYLWYWHNGGHSPRCRRTGRNIGVQLSRVEFRPAPGLGIASLTENGFKIYKALVARYETAGAADAEQRERDFHERSNVS